ncbi:MAG TPA: phosphodiester glycosidase family protein [Sphingomicrobium sp.]|jgi:uncharacterized protein YigE (DUF2233 family)|nr:phosphodiester glycosidase family protein [Sphingomicrobium sp.]
MRLSLASILLLSSCSAPAPPQAPVSPCHEEQFEGSAFQVCEPGSGRIEIRAGHRSFGGLGLPPEQVRFAMNAGMFDDLGAPIGLMIEDGREVHPINRRKGGGNFHLMPNGVFFVRKDGTAGISTSDAFAPSPAIRFATQSGPMLVIDGKINPKFSPDGESRYVRNAVGIDAAGKPHFIISLDVVSFGKMARFVRDRVGARDALYLDGSVSSLWDPAAGRQDDFTELGPIVVVLKPGAESGPDRAGRATP